MTWTTPSLASKSGSTMVALPNVSVPPAQGQLGTASAAVGSTVSWQQRLAVCGGCEGWQPSNELRQTGGQAGKLRLPLDY